MTTTNLAACNRHAAACDRHVEEQELVLLTGDNGEPEERDGLFMCYCEICGVVGCRDPRIVEVARRVPLASRRFWVEAPR